MVSRVSLPLENILRYNSNMNKLISIIVIAVLIIGAFALFKDKSVAPTDMRIETEVPVTENIEESKIKEFNVDASSFKFTSSTLTVNQGDTVKITVTNSLGMHDFNLDEFSAVTKMLKVGESETITFIADKAGEFEYYCSVGTHRAMGMVGKLIVN